MKKYLFFAAIAIAAFVSCQKETAKDEGPVKPGFVKVTLSAQSDVDSKASLNGRQVIWEVGEKVAVFTSADTNPLQFNVDAVDGTSVQFSGEIPAGTESFVAAYPFESAVSWNKSSSVNMKVGNQTVTAAQSVDPKALASVAWFESATATPVFKNTLALLKFTVGVDGVKRVKISTDTAGALAGDVSVAVSASADPAVAGANVKAVEVACEEGFTKDAAYYAAVAPSDYTGFFVNTYVGEEVKLLYTAAEGKIKRNDVLNLGDVATGAKVVEMITEISNAEELAFFLKHAEKYEAGTEVKLTADIDLTGVTLTPASTFAGTFNGQDFSLKNWTSNGVALFAENKGTVKDFTLDASCQLSLPAAITNFAFVVINNLGTVSGIINNADVTGTNVDFKGGRLGAIVGVSTSPSASDALTIENCVNNGDMIITTAANTGGTQYVGTIVGSMGGSTLNNLSECINNGDLSITCSGTNTKNFYMGGVAGGTTNGSNNIKVKNTGNVSFICGGHEAALCLAGVSSYTTGATTDCENTGKITFQSDASLKATFVAGIAGYFASNTMSGCVNRGDVTVTAARINGRNGIGDINSKVYNGTNAITAGLTAGGLVSATGTNPVFADCENYGKVSLTLNNPSSTDGTHTAARPSVGGLVGDCSGPMTGCDNHGDVSVVLGNGTAFTPKNAGYTFYIGGIVGSGYNFCGTTTSGGTDNNKLNKFTLENCNNTGNLYYKTDNTHSTNNAIGGISGWPGSENASTPYTAKNCNNSGDITYEGAGIKIRAGGIHGGTGRMDGCHNTGKITVISADPGSVAGSVAGFHSQAHTFSNCVAEGSVEAQCTINGMGGLAGNLGNVTFTGMDGCSVNCDLIGGPAGKTGLVVGLFNGTDHTITLGSAEDPIEVAGTVNTVPVDASNIDALIAGSTNRTDGVHVIYAGTTAAPKQPALERVWGWYSEGSNLWTANVTAIAISHPDGYGMARGLAMDDEYIYLPKSSAYANMAAVKITDPTQQVAASISGVAGGTTFTSSFVRVIKNTDASVNGGKDVVLLCNLTETNSDANKLQLYAYKDGTAAAPTMIAAFCYDSANNVNDWRRYGDRFTVVGDWSGAKVYFPSFNSNKTVMLEIANGARTSVVQIAAGADNSPEGIKDLTVYPGSDKLFLSNVNIGNLVAPTGGLANGWNEFTLSGSEANGKGTMGYNFFKFNGKDYIAYARISGQKAWIEVIEDKGDLLSSLAAQDGLLKSPIHSAANIDAEHATGNIADCCVREIGGDVYIAALTRDGGLVVDKLVLK